MHVFKWPISSTRIVGHLDLVHHRPVQSEAELVLMESQLEEQERALGNARQACEHEASSLAMVLPFPVADIRVVFALRP